jgi:hypothetical protein
MAVRKNRVGINNKNPETRSAALTVTAISTTHQTVLDIEANGDETEAYIGFRADPMNAGDLTGRIGMEIDGNAYVETNGVKKQLVTPDLIPDSIQIGAIMLA